MYHHFLNLKYGLLALGLALGMSVLHAQAPSVEASLDSTYVIIGSPTTIHLQAIVPKGATVEFPLCQDGIPAFDDTLSYTVELIEPSKIDTTVEGDLMTLKQDLLVASYDSATLMISPLSFVVNGDTLQSDVLPLKVVVPFDVQIDPPARAGELRPVMEPAFVLSDYLLWFIIPLLVIALAVGGYYLYRYYQKRRQQQNQVSTEPQAPALPPHEVAMQALEALGAKKLWQNGFEKQYYTELTDILRDYIYNRFGYQAMEKTSDEIIVAMHGNEEISKSMFLNLKQILQLSDLVKFAKYTPYAEENDLSFVNAKMFVSQTVEIKSINTVRETNTEAEYSEALENN